MRDLWASKANSLAEWTLKNWVRRTDAYGGYRETDVPGEVRMTTQKTHLCPRILRCHFAGVGMPVGLHLCGPDGQGNLIGIDIDAHNEQDDPVKNWQDCLAVCEVARKNGIVPIVTDSNGKGGYHVRLWLTTTHATGTLLSVGRWVVDQAGLPPKTEVFPKQEQMSEFGSWMRLPGPHHKRDHWSRFWDGQRWVGDPAFLLSCVPSAAGFPGKAYGYRRQPTREELAIELRASRPQRVRPADAPERPSERFDRESEWDEILEPHGWSCVRSGAVCQWSRPGVGHTSATTGKVGDRLFVFSANAEPFEQNKSYTKFAAWALLNFDGDWTKATKQYTGPAGKGNGESC